MQLASREKKGWRLSPDLESTLKDLGRRGDIIRSMGAALGDEFSPTRFREFGTESPSKIIGRVAGFGPAGDSHEKRFLAIDGTDGNQWRVVVDLAPGATPPIGAIVELSRASSGQRSSDRIIAAIAKRSGGIYSRDLHTAADPSASENFLEAHKRRLEALRRAGIVEREKDGSWRIPNSFLEQAAEYESSRASARIRVLSWVRLDQLSESCTLTFLDDALESRLRLEASPHRFGREIGDVLSIRRRWLLSRGLAREGADDFQIDRMRLREGVREALAETVVKLSKQLGKEFAPTADGERINGVYRRPIDLPAGRFALIEKSKEFTLVPWRDVLERQRGLEVVGVVRDGGVRWDFSGIRKGPSI